MTSRESTLSLAHRLPRALRRPRFFLVVALLALCGACAARPPAVETRLETARDIARSGALAPRLIAAPGFTLQSYARGTDAELVVYIEGDGFAWRTSRRPSRDPTPISPVALSLAAADPSPAVAYLGRPCQYRLGDAACGSSRHWTSARFSEAVVAASDAAIDALKKDAGAARVHLVGYSGGAAVAALVAARRDDVASLRTVAGYLDPTRLNEERGVSPLTGSLDPVRDAAPFLAGAPQRHYAGGADRVIPAWSVRSFAEAVGDPGCVEVVVAPDAAHGRGWTELWRAVALDRPLCAE